MEIARILTKDEQERNKHEVEQLVRMLHELNFFKNTSIKRDKIKEYTPLLKLSN